MLSKVVAKHVHTINAHTRDVNCVSFSSNTLATCSGDKTVRLWSLDTFGELPASPLCDHTYIVHCCVFSSFGSYMATCSTDGKVILWNGYTGEKIVALEHASKTCIRVCRFSPNSSMLVTGSDDETVCLWDVARRQLIRTLEGHESSVTACAFSPDNSYVISGSMGGDMRVWDARYGHGKNLFFMLDAHDLGMTCCEFSPTYGSAGSDVDHTMATQVSFLLATCGIDNCIKLWDFLATAGSPVVSLKVRQVLEGHTGAVLACCFTPDGRLLASTSGDKTVKLWNPLNGQPLYTIDGHARFVTSCAFSCDGSMLATGSNDRTVMIWKLLTGESLTPDLIKFESSKVDNETTVSSQRGKPVELWDIDDVAKWLNELGLGQYEQNFRANAIDGTELVTLQQDVLENSLGVAALGHRNKIIRSIAQISAHPIIQPPDPDAGVPDEYMCPITHEIMKDPVIAADGYTYERAAITAWLESGKTRSPMTNSVLPSRTFVPNRSLKMLIQRLYHN